MHENPNGQFEKEIDPRSIAVVTGAYYPTFGAENMSEVDRVRGNLALETLAKAKEKGYQVVVGDVGSSPNFMERLYNEGIISNTKKGQGMSPARQQTFREASEREAVEVIAWTEPEKVSLVEECLPEAVRPILDGRADIIVPQRTAEAWATYPKFQAEIEQAANRLWNNILKKNGLLSEDENLDMWFGPKFFKNDPELVKIFTEAYNFEKRSLDSEHHLPPRQYCESQDVCQRTFLSGDTGARKGISSDECPCFVSQSGGANGDGSRQRRIPPQEGYPAQRHHDEYDPLYSHAQK